LGVSPPAAIQGRSNFALPRLLLPLPLLLTWMQHLLLTSTLVLLLLPLLLLTIQADHNASCWLAFHIEVANAAATVPLLLLLLLPPPLDIYAASVADVNAAAAGGGGALLLLLLLLLTVQAHHDASCWLASHVDIKEHLLSYLWYTLCKDSPADAAKQCGKHKRQ
jgi:hypothetical protein